MVLFWCVVRAARARIRKATHLHLMIWHVWRLLDRSHYAPTQSFMLTRSKSSHLTGSSASIDLGCSRSLKRVRHLGMGGRGPFSEHPYPSYTTDELLEFCQLSWKDRLAHISTTYCAHEVQTRSPCVLGTSSFKFQRRSQNVGSDLVISRLRSPASLS
jgi:hypothetical protein